jgi:hypothetical protein
LSIFKLLCTQEPPHRSSRAIQQILQFFFRFLKIPTSSSSIVRNSDQSFGIRTNRSEFGPIVRIRTNRSEFGPISRKFGPITKIRTNQFVRSSFVVRRSLVVFRPSKLEHFQIALHTRTST